MDNVLTKYAELRRDLDRPVTVQVDVAQAFREVYDAAATSQRETESLRYQVERMKARRTLALLQLSDFRGSTDNGLLSDKETT